LNVSSGRPPNAPDPSWDYGNKSSSLLRPAAVTTVYPWLRFEETLLVPTQTMDDFCAKRNMRRIDFVHMDVQGAEQLVLRGAAEMLPCIVAIWVEVAERELYASQPLRTQLEALFQKAGFRVTHQDLRGTEGDQFYINTRFWRCRWRLARLAVGRAMLARRMMAPKT
jgi:hypothetical protein